MYNIYIYICIVDQFKDFLHSDAQRFIEYVVFYKKNITEPTIGISTYTVEWDGIAMAVWDVPFDVRWKLLAAQQKPAKWIFIDVYIHTHMNPHVLWSETWSMFPEKKPINTRNLRVHFPIKKS